MPRSAIMITRSRKLSLKLVYQLTHKTMICRSKCRPLNRSSIGTNRCISSSSPATLAFAPEPIEEGQFHGVDLTVPLGQLEGLHGKAFWVYLNQERIFTSAGRL